MKKLHLLLLALICTLPVLALMPGHPVAQTKTEICDNGIDDDGDKLIDCADPDCKCTPPPGGGTPCSPGWWRHHEGAFNQYCQAAADRPGDQFTTCAQLWTAIWCKGADASCGRQAAASALNAVSNCTE